MKTNEKENEKKKQQKFDKLLNKIWTYLCFLSFPLLFAYDTKRIRIIAKQQSPVFLIAQNLA